MLLRRVSGAQNLHRLTVECAPVEVEVLCCKYYECTTHGCQSQKLTQTFSCRMTGCCCIHSTCNTEYAPAISCSHSTIPPSIQSANLTEKGPNNMVSKCTIMWCNQKITRCGRSKHIKKSTNQCCRHRKNTILS